MQKGTAFSLLFCASLGRDLDPGSAKSTGTVEGKDTWAMTSLKPLSSLWGGVCVLSIFKSLEEHRLAFYFFVTQLTAYKGCLNELLNSV